VIPNRLSSPTGYVGKGQNNRPSAVGVRVLPHSPRPTHSSHTYQFRRRQRPKGRDGILSTLDVLIQVLNIAKGACGIPPAQVVFGSARGRAPDYDSGTFVTTIRRRTLNSGLFRTRWPTIPLQLQRGDMFLAESFLLGEVTNSF
jgi:hypothetical protein